MLTTKTVDRLLGRAHELNAISHFAYDQGYKDEARQIMEAASTLAHAASSIEGKMSAYAAAALGNKEDTAQ